MKIPNKKNIILGILAVLVIIQFFQIDKTPVPVDASQDYLSLTNPPEAVGKLIKDACYDCHSMQTTWPWYTSIQPVGWWIRGHTRGGRIHLDFSKWADYDAGKQAHKLEECVEQMEEQLMPLKSYTWTHPEAQLSDTDRAALIAWFKK